MDSTMESMDGAVSVHSHTDLDLLTLQGDFYQINQITIISNYSQKI